LSVSAHLAGAAVLYFLRSVDSNQSRREECEGTSGWPLFALDTKLDLGPDATRDEVMTAINGHILGKAVWEGRFHRHQ